MLLNLEFPSQLMKTVIGGYSTIDVPRLDFVSVDEVSQFLKVYGYDLAVPAEEDEVWRIFKASVDIMERYILEPGEQIPEIVKTREGLQDIRRLMVYASTKDHAKNKIQMWSCAILRVMHCLAHVENDLFFNYTSEIQDQILRPVQQRVHSLPHGEVVLGAEGESDQVTLLKFEAKAFKETHSMVIKTLSKPESVAMDIYDKVGMRFVTGSIFDAFRVVRYLRTENIVNFANIVPNQSKNTLFPTNLFLEVIEEFRSLKKPVNSEQVETRLKEILQSESHRAQFKEKKNPFSDDSYKIIKFIGRQMIKVKAPSGNFVKFFYPYELQIVDYQTYLFNMSGTSAHGEYKQRQRKAARERMLGELLFTPDQGAMM